MFPSDPHNGAVHGGGGNRTRELFPHEPGRRAKKWFLPVLVVAALLTAGTVEHSGSAADAAHAARTPLARPALLTTIKLTMAFACIHSFEGAWTADTGNDYHGGLQMDATFERQYGAAALRRWGHAENWPPSVQIQVAIRAERSGRGFAPWPQTARKCGLL